ncbi:hypothetical protein C922_05284 [Plasmodium inui San Antonio 1]|uniref:Sporozoite invasion-associated protein 2 n=1 Tax=Plasmodium inui San Antonio 1 TaxID=1237626 RepID=W6ZYG7_9APIC|nr:hypothetical protein C922_05284 [Plasmodium inui San Antonio 1]EUD64345.1 hypothetical protein C922_05284 [Plasmodium inui San Antonio 1]
METRRKYYYYYYYYYFHSFLISIGTLLFFTSTFMMCSSSQLEPAPNPDSTSPPVHLLQDEYAPTLEDIFGPHASQIMTGLYEIIDEDATTTGGYANRPDDDQSNQSNTNDDAVLLSSWSSDKDSFDELMEEIDSDKKKKKRRYPLRRTIFKTSDSSDSLSDYEHEDEIVQQTQYEQLQEQEEDLDPLSDDSLSDEPFEVINHPWKDKLESFSCDTNLTNEDDPYSLEELQLDDPAENVKFGKLKFFGMEDIDLFKKKEPIAPTTTGSNLRKNGNNSEASHINQHEHEKMDRRKRRTHRHFKNPIEFFSVTTTYDMFLKENGLRDHPSKHQKNIGEPFPLNQYYYRDAKYNNARHYVLKMLYDNLRGLGQKEYQYLKENQYEVQDFIRRILKTSFICLTFSQEAQLFKDANMLIDKASIKSINIKTNIKTNINPNINTYIKTNIKRNIETPIQNKHEH